MGGVIDVRGGANGVEAHYDDMVATARCFGAAATDTAGSALALHGCLAHPAVLASVGFDPVGAARFEMSLLATLDGAHGVSLLAARCAAIDAGLRAAACAYAAADRMAADLSPLRDLLARLPRAQLAAVGTLVASGDATAAAQVLVTGDPQLADLGITTLADLLGGSVPAASALLAGLFDDGEPQVTSLGDDPDATAPPRSVADLMAGLDRRNQGASGEIDVRILGGSTGRRHVIVDILGTKDWAPTARNGDITSLATNLRALSGLRTSYELGVLEALRRAGIRADDDVLLVGHSEGGLVAVNAATHLARSGEFHVSHVITAGSPVGISAATVPRSVSVLAIENDGDVVAHLDGAQNPDRVNITTVTLRRRTSDVVANHDITGTYLPGARDIDSSDDASVRAYLAGLGGFLTAQSAHTVTYRISRAYK